MILWLRVTLSRLQAVFLKGRLDREFDDELRDHLEALGEQYEAAGMSREEARRAAVRKLGNQQQLREANRDYRGLPLLETAAQDFRYALRTLWKNRGFASIAVVMLALGIGLCSCLFSYHNALVLQPAPGVREPARLVALQAPVTYPYFESYRDASGVASAAAVFIGPVPFGIGLDGAGAGRPERIFGHLVSADYFSTIGAEPSLGRFFDPAKERTGTAATVVVSERFWRMRLNADPGVVGRILRINGQRATIVGVGRKGFLGVFPAATADIFLPLTVDAAFAPELAGDVLHNANSPVFNCVFRLAPKMSIAAAETALDGQTKRLNEHAGKDRDTNRNRRGRLIQLVMAGGVSPMSIEQRSIFAGIFGLMMGLILSFTCANLAGLMLARGSARGKEIAIRLSVGATRSRLIRQLLVESVTIATIGGAAGLAVTYGLLNLLSDFLAGSAPFASEIRVTPDLRVTLLTFAISALAGAGFGLMPALATTRPDLMTGLKGAATAGLGRHRRFSMRNLFMVYQVASAMALVLVVGFMITGIRQGMSRDPGFDTAGLYLFSIDPARDGYSPDESAAMLTRLPERLGRLNGVEGVTLAEPGPFNNLAAPNTDVSTTGPGAQESTHRVSLQTIGPDFFATLHAPVLRGMEFGSRDLRSDPGTDAILPAVINHSAAKELFGDVDPLGRVIRQGARSFQVAGVVRFGMPSFFKKEAMPTVFLPLTMKNLRRGTKGFRVAFRARPGLDFTAIRGELEAIDSRLTMFDPRTMQEQLTMLDRSVQYTTAIYPAVGLFALILACVGLAGVTAQDVARRRREIGIRMALGAHRWQVLRLVMMQGTAMVLIGSSIGFAGAYGFSRVLGSMAAEVAKVVDSNAGNPMLSVGAPLLLVLLSAIACYLPARRSTTIDPLIVLREE